MNSSRVHPELTAAQVVCSLNEITITESVRRAMRLYRELRVANNDHGLQNAHCVARHRAVQLDAIALPHFTAIEPEYTLRRRIRLLRMRNVQTHAYSKKWVGAGKQEKVADVIVQYRAQRRERMREFALTTIITNEQGHSYSLADLANTPEKRAAEFYVRAIGQEQFGARRGLVPLFITATLPPQLHPAPSHGANGWDGTMPWQALPTLQRSWKRVQGGLLRAGIRIFGVRVYEAHRDGCPHFHSVLYIKPKQLLTICREFRRVFPGRHACRFELITPEAARRAGKSYAKPSSYVMKYALKQFRSVADCENRDDAWKALCAARTIQFFDVRGSTSLWRETRRVHENTPQYFELTKKKHGAALWKAATQSGPTLDNGRKPGDYCEFLEALFALRNDECQARLLYSLRESGTKKLDGFVLFVHDTAARILTHVRKWTRSQAKEDQLGEVRHTYPRLNSDNSLLKHDPLFAFYRHKNYTPSRL